MMTVDKETMMNGGGEQDLIEELGNLLVRRDRLCKEAETYRILYTQEFGELIVANFELKIECIGKRKAISYCRRRMNRGLAVDVRRMQAELDEEMKLYYVQLHDMIEATEAAKEAKSVDENRSGRETESLGEEVFLPDGDDLERQIECVECRINDILTTEPYIYGELLRDPEKKEALRARLQEEHDDYEQYLHMLEKTLEEMLGGGEAKPVWNMKL